MPDGDDRLMPSHPPSGLILIGHGSARHPHSGQPLHALARAMEDLGPWTARAAFMKQSPSPAQVLAQMTTDRVVVVPVFAGQGYYTDTLVPAAVPAPPDKRILFTPPVGCHPLIPDLLARRGETVAIQAGLDPHRTSLLMIAHGSSRPGGSGQTARGIATAIDALNRFGQVVLTFLEQSPLATDWPMLVNQPHVVALPLLIAQGTHASQDIPALFPPSAAGTPPVHLALELGAEPDLAAIIAAMAHDALMRG